MVASGFSLGLVGLLAITAIAGLSSAGAGQEAGSEIGPPLERAGASREGGLRARLLRGEADPVGDARRAAQSRDFRLVWVSGMVRSAPIGLQCDAPLQYWANNKKAALATLVVSDTVPDGCEGEPRECEYQARLSSYGSTYNRTLVMQPGYPAPDVCRPWVSTDKVLVGEAVDRYGRPARTVRHAPLDLHDAARRGSAAEVAQHLRRTPVDERDVFGMTPLAWAVARDRSGAVRVLLKAGADPYPDLERGEYRRSPLWLGLRLGRRSAVQALLAKVEEPHLTHLFDLLMAAVEGGDPELLRAMLKFERNDESLTGPMEAALRADRDDLIAILAAEGGNATATALLSAAARTGDVEAAKTAIGRGADVHGPGSPLGQVILGLHEGDEAILDLLLAAGADVNRTAVGNRMSGPPLRIAIQHAYRGSLKGADKLAAERQQRIILRLAAAGAVDRTNFAEQAPLGFIAVVGWNARNAPTPGQLVAPLPYEILKALRTAGVDFNARYHGQTVATWVEIAQPDAPVLAELRELAAR